jgi:hypothetical protein
MSPYRSFASGPFDLPTRMKSELTRELAAGEQLVWIGRPETRTLLKEGVTSLSLPLFWNVSIMTLIAFAAQEKGPAWLCAVPLLALGAPLFRPSVACIEAARSTFYVVTDRRAIVFDGDIALSYPASTLAGLALCERSDGSGDLVFITRPAREKRPGFFAVPAVRRVETLVREHVLGA